MVMMVLLLEVFWTIVVHSPFFTDAACFRVEIPIFRWWNPNSEMVKSPFWMVIYVYIYISLYLSIYLNHVSYVSSIFLVICFSIFGTHESPGLHEEAVRQLVPSLAPGLGLGRIHEPPTRGALQGEPGSRRCGGGYDMCVMEDVYPLVI